MAPKEDSPPRGKPSGDLDGSLDLQRLKVKSIARFCFQTEFSKTASSVWAWMYVCFWSGYECERERYLDEGQAS